MLKLTQTAPGQFDLAPENSATGDAKPGKDGHSPYIGENGNWFAFDDAAQAFVDSGVKARGEDGKSLNILGNVPTCADLPASAEVNDAYCVEANGLLYICGATGWPAEGAGVAWRGKDGEAAPRRVPYTALHVGASHMANIFGTLPVTATAALNGGNTLSIQPNCLVREGSRITARFAGRPGVVAAPVAKVTTDGAPTDFQVRYTGASVPAGSLAVMADARLESD